MEAAGWISSSVEGSDSFFPPLAAVAAEVEGADPGTVSTGFVAESTEAEGASTELSGGETTSLGDCYPTN